MSDTVYKELEKEKGSQLSFSKIIAVLLDSYKKSSDIRKFAGALRGRDADTWLNEVTEGRKKGFKRKIG
ncbi:MAG: antitoxin VapB family protein [Candidatus Micrarchaeales archaeon]